VPSRRGGRRGGASAPRPSVASKTPPGHRWVVGTHSCFEALASRADWVEEVVCLEGKEFSEAEAKCLKPFQKKSQIRGKGFFDKLSEVHQGIAVRLSERPRWGEGHPQKPLVAFLDGLNDPHNLGAILRTGWLFDMGGLFLPKNRTVTLTPTVAKIASGGAEHVPIEEVHFQSQTEGLKKQGYWIFGLSEKAEVSLFDVDLPKKTAFIMGAEGKGMRSSSENLCDQLVSIPQVTSAASLNVSVAFSLAVYEYQRQQAKAPVPE